MTGTAISHYQILDKVGEGATSVVYRAEDLKLGRIVALKFLNSEVSCSASNRRRFLHEAEAAAMIVHPNVCPVYGCEEADGHMFLVMAFVEGSSLASLLSSGPMRLSDALRIAIEVAEALNAAHAMRILHRDIKPGNILIATDGQVRITDFGLALLSERTRITEPGMINGTAAYMSPEQALTAPVDRRTDVWSLGVVLYEMIAGVRPFQGPHLQSILASVIGAPLPELTCKEPLPEFLKTVVSKALEKDPEQRYQFVDDLVVDLRAVLRDLPASSGEKLKFAATAVNDAANSQMETLIAPFKSPLQATIQFISGKLRGGPDRQ